jgi:hypothetical protein
MKTNYLQAKRELIEKGIDFGKDVFLLTSEENKLIERAAKKYKYKISSCGNSCLGGILHCRFYMLLQKVNL